jgi:hypothetical protein
VAGSAAAFLLLGDVGPTGVWPVAILPVALLLIVRALLRLVQLGRAEWRREPYGARAYVGVITRFFVAYLIVAIASS